MNEDKRYDHFPYIRGENVVKLVGGPLHNQYVQWMGGFRDVRFPHCEPMYKFDIDYENPIGPSPLKICNYRLFKETFWITSIGVVRLWGGYFTGFV